MAFEFTQKHILKQRFIKKTERKIARYYKYREV